MPAIKELPEGVWTRIAAGEVVERPASAVKEMVENALDAGARRVRARLWDGGRLRIVVEDDGCGIALGDLPLALTPHATSKISGVEDLESIQTLGYRGEALASLTAVAGVEILSRPGESQEGGLIRASSGRVVEHRAASCTPGTRVQVDEIFGNLPARRKFLKSAAGELRRAAACLREYAVCRPDVAFSLEHDGREVFSTDGSGDRRRVLERLWGPTPPIQTANAAAGHLSLECWQQPRPGVKGQGGRSDVMAFVNGRAVNDPLVKGAVGAGARELTGNWALFLSLDPGLVDVNIHPAKAEVRFRYPGEIFEAVRQAAAQLGGPAVVPLGEESSPDAPPSGEGGRAAAMARGWSFRDGPPAGRAPSVPPAHRRESGRYGRPGDYRPIAPPDFGPPPAAAPREPPTPYEPPSLTDEAPAPSYMGQTRLGYLVFDAPEGLMVVDPHAAHERVEYERVRARVREGGGTQALMPVPLPPTLALEAEEYRAELAEAGFALEDRDGGLHLRSVPSLSVEVEPEALLRASLAALKAGDGGDPRELLWRTWATVACKAAVKLTAALSREEALALWRGLEACEQPFLCPHGRPTMLKLSGGDLTKHFGRT